VADTMRKNIDAGVRGGAARISVEAFVMKVEREREHESRWAYEQDK
jgi:hypothetical protein